MFLNEWLHSPLVESASHAMVPILFATICLLLFVSSYCIFLLSRELDLLVKNQNDLFRAFKEHSALDLKLEETRKKEMLFYWDRLEVISEHLQEVRDLLERHLLADHGKQFKDLFNNEFPKGSKRNSFS